MTCKQLSIILLFGICFLVACKFSDEENQETPSPVLETSIDFGAINPSAPAQLKDYGQLVGKWDCTIANLDSTNAWVENQATWVFTYILDGHAIQDYWTNPGKQGPDTKIYRGTNIRIYNPKLQIWQCTWLENSTYAMSGIWQSYRNDANEIILHDGSGTWEIVFFNISEKKFDWRWDVQQKDGSMKTVSKIQAMKAA